MPAEKFLPELQKRLGDRIIHVGMVLFDDDLPLGREQCFVKRQTIHAVGFEFEKHVAELARDAAGIDRHVFRRKGIAVAAHIIDHPGMFLAFNVRRAAKHHMFEHVGDTANAVAFANAPRFIPELRRDDRSARFTQRDHLQTVIERFFGDVIEKHCRYMSEKVKTPQLKNRRPLQTTLCPFPPGLPLHP